MRRASILVVEDDSSALEAIAGMLQSFGYACRTAADGEEALNFAPWDKFDMILSNLHIPGPNGLQLMSMVRNTAPDMPFIITSGHIQEHTYTQVFEAGADDFLVKPFRGDELRARMNRILKQRLKGINLSPDDWRVFKDLVGKIDKAISKQH